MNTDNNLGESQWFQPTVRNRLSKAIVLANFDIEYGKFYDIKNPYNQTISAQGTRIPSKGEHSFGHCGRESSFSGTEGSFEIQFNGTREKIGKVYWDCPWSGRNKIRKSEVKPGYDISFDGFSIPSGPLGSGTITIRVD